MAVLTVDTWIVIDMLYSKDKEGFGWKCQLSLDPCCGGVD